MTKASAAAFLVLLLSSAAFAGWNPDGWEVRPRETDEGATHPAALALNSLLGLYRGFISPIDASNCPSYPSCSAYSLAAIKKHGPLKGAVLTASRLVSEADEAAFSGWFYVGGEAKVWYPVESALFPESDR